MLASIAVNVVGLGLCLYAYSRPWQWERGPLLMLRGASVVLGIALVCTLAGLLLDVPEARGVAVAAAIAALGVLIWRRRGAAVRRGLLTSVAAAPDAGQLSQPRTRPAKPARGTSGGWASVTVRDIENMEVQP